MASADRQQQPLVACDTEVGTLLDDQAVTPRAHQAVTPRARQAPPRAWRAPAKLWVLVVGLVGATCLLWPRQEPRRKRSPVEVSAVADGLVSELELPPANFDYSTPVALRWPKSPGLCVRADASLALSVDDCSTESGEFIVQQGLQGPIKLARDATLCLGFNDQTHALTWTPCGSFPAEWVIKKQHIQLKSNTDLCILVNVWRKDVKGRHPLEVKDCELWNGDLIQMPEPADYVFDVDWPEVTTTVTATFTSSTSSSTGTNTTTTEETTTATVAASRLPPKTILRSVHGKYLVVELGGALFANRGFANDWEKFDVEYKSEGVVALKSYHGFYVSCDPIGTLMATARTATFDDTSFEVSFVNDGAVVLKGANGLYVTADPVGFVRASGYKPGDWQEFVVLDVASTWPPHVAIKTYHHKFWRAYPSGDITADGVWPLDAWERFHVSYHDDQTISLRSDHGEYVSVQPSDGFVVVKKEIAYSERFNLTHLSDGNFTMQDHTGKFIWAGPDGKIRAQHTIALDAWEKMEVVFLS